MVKKLVAGLLALFVANAVSAQTFPQPPDITGTPAVVTPVYSAGAATPAVPNLGTPPQAGLSDIASPNRTELLSTANVSFCTVTGASPPCGQAKFRTLSEVTHVLYDDPIRNYSQPGGAHCHMFFGNRSVNAYSTFATLRNRSKKFSRGAGGGLNGTGYWFPCMVQENFGGTGITYAPRPGTIIIYYVEDPLLTARLNSPPLGLRYVTGYNMSDGGAYMDGVVAAANTANVAAGGAAGRYAKPILQKAGWSQHQWYCNDTNGNTVARTVAGSNTAYFVEPDGSDPWGGTCTAGMSLNIQAQGAKCWDGTNLWIATGYTHLIPAIKDNQTANPDSEFYWVCPNNYYRLPQLQVNFSWKHNGFAQYSQWHLASDPITGAANTGVINGNTVRRGETFHTDWMGGWDGVTFTTWLNACLGTGGNTPHECNNSTISATNTLVLTTNPQTGKAIAPYPTTSPNTVAGDMIRLPATKQNSGAELHAH